MKTGTTTMEFSVAVLQKAGKRSTSRHSYGCQAYSQRTQTSYYRDTCTSMLIFALFIISRNWRQIICSLINDNENVVYLHNGIYSPVKKKWHYEICRQIYDNQKIATDKMPMNWMDNETWSIYMTEYYSAVKKVKL